MLSACTGPYTVTHRLRGSGPQPLYYIYPPGSGPDVPAKVVLPLTHAPSGCTPNVSTSFTISFRHSRFLAPAAVVRDRGKLPKSRGDFDAEADALIGGSCLTDDEKSSLRTRLWERMPKTFVDDLFDRYHYDTLNRTIDLQPGMRLRFEWQSFFDPDRTAEQRGYVGAGTSYFVVARRPHHVAEGATDDAGMLTFEPFLGWTDTGVDRTSRPRIAGELDLEGTALARKFYRLVMPANGFGKTSAPANVAGSRIALIGANTPDGLDSNPDCNQINGEVSPDQPICTIVAGRTLVVPEVAVWINGKDAYLPVGVTLHHVIDRDGRRWSARSNLPLYRYYRGHLVPVVFEDPDEDALDLPLVKGDRLSW